MQTGGLPVAMPGQQANGVPESAPHTWSQGQLLHGVAGRYLRHEPATQSSEPVHVVPQSPQWSGSVWKSTHAT